MEKKLLLIIAGFFMISLIGIVVAQNPEVYKNGVDLESSELKEIAQNVKQAYESNGSQGVMKKSKVMAGNYLSESGLQMMIQEKSNERIRLEVGGVSADCVDCNMTQEQVQNKTKLYATLSNGKNAEIKIMPNTASETALERLRLRVCNESNNCSIELKEVGAGEKSKMAYEVQAQRQSKVFGLFSAKMNVESQVDAETGEIIKVNKPWWAFLASEPAE